MGRIDKNNGQDTVLKQRHIRQMLRHIDEYEAIKQKRHPKYHLVQELWDNKGIVKQNFLKYYRRYINADRDANALIPHKTGRKFKDCIEYAPEVTDKVAALRQKAYNRYDISTILKEKHDIDMSSSGIYRLLKKLKLNKLNPIIKEEKRRIIKKEAGELGHIDIHYIAKGSVEALGNKRVYLLGVIDSYSRLCWLETLTSIKSLDVSFATLDILTRLQSRYSVEFKEMLSDNGSEFASRNNTENHPFEKMLKFIGIKHRYTKPCCPQTNGKIERFWRTIEEELLSGETFKTLDELNHYIQGYCLYYNEHRRHQGIQLKMPCEMVEKEQ